jgi:hypothetical protein
MTRGTRRLCVAVGTASLLVGCSLAHAAPEPLPRAPVQDAWPLARTEAARAVTATHYGAADKLLADFAAQYPATAEASEASYWRALYRADPANDSSSAHDAVVLLDAYLTAPLDSTHRAAALTLRRITVRLEQAAAAAALASANTATVPATGANSGATKSDDRARDDELERVKDELAKANAELERIKRRLAQPKP